MEEEQLCSGPRFHKGHLREITVYLTQDTDSSTLQVWAQAYGERSDETGSSRLVGFTRDTVPSHGMLQLWAEKEIEREPNKDFCSALQKFLLAYAHDGEGLPKVSMLSRTPCPSD